MQEVLVGSWSQTRYGLSSSGTGIGVAAPALARVFLIAMATPAAGISPPVVLEWQPKKVV